VKNDGTVKRIIFVFSNSQMIHFSSYSLHCLHLVDAADVQTIDVADLKPHYSCLHLDFVQGMQTMFRIIFLSISFHNNFLNRHKQPGNEDEVRNMQHANMPRCYMNKEFY
jgi:hypothetical protein